jgi:dihydrofolate synthase/folylpolyglutamate synthase
VGEGWSDENIRNGLKNTALATGLRGRWEYLSKNPPVVCDTGHNVNGLTMVFSQLRRERYKRLFSIVGFVADKDIEKIVGLLPSASYFFFTQAKIERALDAKILEKKCKSVGLKGEVSPTVEDAIMRFKEIYREGDFLFIGGSTFIVAEAIDFFEKNDNYFCKIEK